MNNSFFVYRLITAICLLLSGLPTNAQLSTRPVRHFIICVDGAMPAYTQKLMHVSTKEYVGMILKTMNFCEDDYISVVSYQLDIKHPDFSNFAWIPFNDHNVKLKWCHLPNGVNDIEPWSSIVGCQHSERCKISDRKVSFQSAAKQYALQALTNSGKAANETYLLMLTDEKVNGVDDNYQNEWKNISTPPDARLAPFKNEVFKTLEYSNKIYHFTPFKVKGNDKHIIYWTMQDPFVLAIYKVELNTIPAIQSIAKIPAQLPVKRVRGGYRFELDLNTKKENYSVEKIELSIDKNSKRFSANSSFINIKIDKNFLKDGDTIRLKTWVKFIDNAYNGCLLSPYVEDCKDALTIVQAMELKDDSKIFGKFDLLDFFWWFFPNDVQSAVITWDIIIILIFIIIICIIAYGIFNKLTRYVPDNSAIKIVKMKSCK